MLYINHIKKHYMYNKIFFQNRLSQYLIKTANRNMLVKQSIKKLSNILI